MDEHNRSTIDSSNKDAKRYVFWLDDITVLFRDGAYVKFYPTRDMTRIEQLNALSRLFFYLIVLLFLFDKNIEWMYIPIIGLILCIILYNVFEVDDKGKRDEYFRMQHKEAISVGDQPVEYDRYARYDRSNGCNGNNCDKYDEYNEYNGYNGYGNGYEDNIDSKYREGYINTESNISNKNEIDNNSKYVENFELPNLKILADKKNADIEACYYDSDGELVCGKNYDSSTQGVAGSFTPLTQRAREFRERDNTKFSLDQMRLYEKNTCRRPTVDNPYMNPSVNDFNKEEIPPPVACNADDEDIHKEIDKTFDADLYRDLEDVFNRKNSQRQFFTVPHNVPNDQEAFARWCYKFPATCKTDQEYCLRYQDLRTKY